MIWVLMALLFGIYPFLAIQDRRNYHRNANWVHIALLYFFTGNVTNFASITNTSPAWAVTTWILVPWFIGIGLGELIHYNPLHFLRRE